MSKTKKVKKIGEPYAQEKIYKVMLIMTFVVAGFYLVKNLIGQTWVGAIAIGGSVSVIALIAFIMRKVHASQYTKQFVFCLCLPVLVFFISIFSGAYYSDDFPLFLAVVGLTGMYLEPSYTKVQMVEIPVFLIALYFINPEKADPMGQYIMCVVIFELAAFTFLMAIERGRAFIEVTLKQHDEAAKLLSSIKNVGEELEENYEISSSRIAGMREANENLEQSAQELMRGSGEISMGTHEVENTCDEVQRYMQITEGHIDSLNQEVRLVEAALSENKENMQAMDSRMQIVKETVGATKEVFEQLKQQIEQISDVTGQLTKIAANTKMLALNASIEAARAGESGAGFAVVASQVQNLALNSNRCSDQVIVVVENMKNQIERTTEQLEESVEAIDGSLGSLDELEEGFGSLIDSFGSLYNNIEEQNKNVKNVDMIFGSLRSKVGEMSTSSEVNQAVVELIVDAMGEYKEHMNKIVGDTMTIHELSASMLELSGDDGQEAKEAITTVENQEDAEMV